MTKSLIDLYTDINISPAAEAYLDMQMIIISHSINITGTPLSGPATLGVTFASNAFTSSGTITSYAWTFGDGGTSTAANPVYFYTTPGIYTVALTVTFSAFSPLTQTNTNYITVTAPAVTYGGGIFQGVILKSLRIGHP
jgi:PKD repeat protein